MRQNLTWLDVSQEELFWTTSNKSYVGPNALVSMVFVKRKQCNWIARSLALVAHSADGAQYLAVHIFLGKSFLRLNEKIPFLG